jgi:hypothetical protein
MVEVKTWRLYLQGSKDQIDGPLASVSQIAIGHARIDASL